MNGKKDWIYQLSSSDLSEVDVALKNVASLNLRKEVHIQPYNRGELWNYQMYYYTIDFTGPHDSLMCMWATGHLLHS